MNNAGTAVVGGIETTSVSDLDRMFAVNTMSVFMMTKEVLPHLIETKGSIEFIFLFIF